MARQAGYLKIDHSASPGLPEEFARAAGYDPKLTGEGKVYEVDTLFCSHCGCCVVPNPERVRPRGKCMECNSKEGHYICDPCDYNRTQPGYVHTPFKKVVENLLNQAVMGSPPKLLMP